MADNNEKAPATQATQATQITQVTDITYPLLTPEEKAHLQIGDYMDGDGNWRCGVCGEIKGMPDLFAKHLRASQEKGEPDDYVKLAAIYGGWEKMNWPVCGCFKRKREAEELRRRAAVYREDCFVHPNMYAKTFDSSERQSEEIERAKRYAENFDELRKGGFGMLLYGECGTGKTHIAAMTANAIIDSGRRVRFRQIESLYRDYIAERDKNDWLDRLASYALVVLDDLGAESPQLKSFAFTVIDRLYVAMTPFIVTTNLGPDRMAQPRDETEQRLFTRILERCPVPIYVSEKGGTIRNEKMRASVRSYMRLLS